MKFVAAALVAALSMPVLADECDEAKAKAALSLAKAKREREASVKAGKPTGRLLLREVYEVDGKKVGVEEFTSVPAKPTTQSKACPMCGPACDCKSCDCDASAWNGRCKAAPKVAVVPLPGQFVPLFPPPMRVTPLGQRTIYATAPMYAAPRFAAIEECEGGG